MEPTEHRPQEEGSGLGRWYKSTFASSFKLVVEPTEPQDPPRGRIRVEPNMKSYLPKTSAATAAAAALLLGPPPPAATARLWAWVSRQKRSILNCVRHSWLREMEKRI